MNAMVEQSYARAKQEILSHFHLEARNETASEFYLRVRDLTKAEGVDLFFGKLTDIYNRAAYSPWTTSDQVQDALESSAQLVEKLRSQVVKDLEISEASPTGVTFQSNPQELTMQGVAETRPTGVTAQSMLEKPTMQRVAQRPFRPRILRSRAAEVLMLTALVFGMFVWKSTLTATWINPGRILLYTFSTRTTYYLGDYQCTSGLDPLYCQK